jgi:hypothetical protein
MATHRGVGDRLLDGRQVTIMSLLQHGDHDQATAMVDASNITEPWEKPVAAILRTYCLREDSDTARKDLDTAVAEALALIRQIEPSTVVFRTRVALTALDLAEPYEALDRSPLSAAVLLQASTDAYAAREALASTTLRSSITTEDERRLADVVKSSGLGRGSMPVDLLDKLMASVHIAADELRLLLHSATLARGPHSCPSEFRC